MSAPTPDQARQSVIDACRRAWERGLLSGFNGNLSLRLGDACLITCAGAAKGYLRTEDLVTVLLKVASEPGLQPLLADTGGATFYAGSDAVSAMPPRQPSSELGMHLSLYHARPDIAAIVHTHPSRLLALSLKTAERDFLRLPLFEAETLRAGLAFVPSLSPGTPELANAAAIAAAPVEIRALWLQGHGLTCLGKTLTQALALAEELEHLAGVQLLA